MIVDLPITQAGAHFGFATELDGVTFGFTFRWNDRLEAWFMDVLDGDGTVLVAGVRCVLGLPLLARYNSPKLPAGYLLCRDTSGLGREAGFEDLGRRVIIIYASFAELA